MCSKMLLYYIMQTENKKEYYRNYYLANKDKLNAKHRDYYHAKKNKTKEKLEDIKKDVEKLKEKIHLLDGHDDENIDILIFITL